MIATRTHSDIPRYFRLLVLITGAAAALMLGSILLRYSEDRADRDRVDRYHVWTLLLGGEATEHVHQLRRDFDHEEPAAQRLFASRHQTSASLSSLRVAYDSIAALQSEFNEPSTRASVDRAGRELDAIAASLAAPELDALLFDLQLVELGQSLLQLRRLHSFEITETIDRSLVSASARDLWTLGFAIAILLSAAAVIRGIFRQMRASIERHSVLELAVREGERQLHSSQKMDALGMLIGGVAHDFNNDLGIILGNLIFVARGVADDQEMARRVETIRHAAEKAAGLTESLLTFAGRGPVEASSMAVNKRIADMTTFLNRALGPNVTVNLDLVPDCWPVEMDDALFDSCIVNLANNSRDAMPKGGTVTISTRNIVVYDPLPTATEQVTPGDYVVVQVSDSGEGMSSETVRRVFEPFFTTKPEGRGTGLGLSMVYGFVKQCNGYIEVDSTTGLGTAVRLYLSRCEDESATVSAVPEHGSDASSSSPDATIQLVDDN